MGRDRREEESQGRPGGEPEEPRGEALEREDRDSARIVARVQAGDSEEYAKLYLRYFDRIFKYAQVALDDPDGAEDIAQTVFANGFESIARYKPSLAPFRAWIFSIARNETIDELTRRGRIEPMEPEELDRRREQEAAQEGDADLSALDWINDGDLQTLMDRLPLPQRQVLLLRYLLDLPFAQIGSALSRNEEDVRKLHSRALLFLRDRLTALGRAPNRKQAPVTRVNRQAPVIRTRRWSLHGW